MRILNKPFRFTPRFGAIAAACILAGAAWADGNTVYLSQMGDGNVITVDQSAASNSIVRGAQGPNGVGGGPAAQIGTGNSASITVTDAGTESDVSFFQRNPSGGTGNSAFVEVGALAGVLSSQPLAAVASLFQAGDGNHSSISVTGPGSEGAVTQIGTDNDADLSVTGTRASGTILQRGNGNVLGVEVTGNDMVVAYEQVGDNIGTDSTVPVRVFSTAPQVLIRQSALGGS
jgi:hypothetical protein